MNEDNLVVNRDEYIRQKMVADGLFCIKDYGHTSNHQ